MGLCLPMMTRTICSRARDEAASRQRRMGGRAPREEPREDGAESAVRDSPVLRGGPWPDLLHQQTTSAGTADVLSAAAQSKSNRAEHSILVKRLENAP